MQGYAAVPTLMFATLGIALVIGIIMLLRFFRKKSNRHPMEHQKERNIDEIRRGVPPEQ